MTCSSKRQKRLLKRLERQAAQDSGSTARRPAGCGTASEPAHVQQQQQKGPGGEVQEAAVLLPEVEAAAGYRAAVPQAPLLWPGPEQLQQLQLQLQQLPTGAQGGAAILPPAGGAAGEASQLGQPLQQDTILGMDVQPVIEELMALGYSEAEAQQACLLYHHNRGNAQLEEVARWLDLRLDGDSDLQPLAPAEMAQATWAGSNSLEAAAAEPLPALPPGSGDAPLLSPPGYKAAAISLILSGLAGNASPASAAAAQLHLASLAALPPPATPSSAAAPQRPRPAPEELRGHGEAASGSVPAAAGGGEAAASAGDAETLRDQPRLPLPPPPPLPLPPPPLQQQQQLQRAVLQVVQEQQQHVRLRLQLLSLQRQLQMAGSRPCSAASDAPGPSGAAAACGEVAAADAAETVEDVDLNAMKQQLHALELQLGSLIAMQQQGGAAALQQLLPLWSLLAPEDGTQQPASAEAVAAAAAAQRSCAAFAQMMVNPYLQQALQAPQLQLQQPEPPPALRPQSRAEARPQDDAAAGWSGDGEQGLLQPLPLWQPAAAAACSRPPARAATGTRDAARLADGSTASTAARVVLPREGSQGAAGKDLSRVELNMAAGGYAAAETTAPGLRRLRSGFEHLSRPALPPSGRQLPEQEAAAGQDRTGESSTAGDRRPRESTAPEARPDGGGQTAGSRAGEVEVPGVGEEEGGAARIARLQKQQAQLEAENAKLNEHCRWADTRIQQLLKKACVVEKPLREADMLLQAEVNDLRRDREQLEQRCMELQGSLVQLKEACMLEADRRQQAEQLVEHDQAELRAAALREQELQKQLQDVLAEVKAGRKRVAGFDKQRLKLREEKAAAERAAAEVEAQLRRLQDRAAQAEAQASQRKAAMGAAQAELQDAKRRLAGLEAEAAQAAQRLQKQVLQKDGMLAQLREQVDALTAQVLAKATECRRLQAKLQAQAHRAAAVPPGEADENRSGNGIARSAAAREGPLPYCALVPDAQQAGPQGGRLEAAARMLQEVLRSLQGAELPPGRKLHNGETVSGRGRNGDSGGGACGQELLRTMEALSAQVERLEADAREELEEQQELNGNLVLQNERLMQQRDCLRQQVSAFGGTPVV